MISYMEGTHLRRGTWVVNAEIAVGIVVLIIIGCELSDVWRITSRPASDSAAWLLIAYGTFVAVVAALACRDDFIEPLSWSGLTGYLTGAAILLGVLARGETPSRFVWAASFVVFAAVALGLAATLYERRVLRGTGFFVTTLAIAAALALTLGSPIVEAHRELWIYVIAAFVATSITLLLLFLNENTYGKRRFALQQLLDELYFAMPTIPQAQISPLTLAAHKYHAVIRSMEAPPQGEGPQTVAQHGLLEHHPPQPSRWPLIASGSAYLIFCTIGYILLLVPLSLLFGCGTTSGCTPPSGWMSNGALFWTESNPAETAALIKTVAVAGVAFLGAHIFTLRYLFKSALNSELNQFKWIRAALHLLTGVVAAVILYRALEGTGWVSGLLGAATGSSFAAWLGVGFVIGWVPDFALTTLVRYLHIKSMKSIDEDAQSLIAAVPVEMVDGIDYDVRYRLEENNIIDVQNLATYDPILLYVETPFGLTQIFDWVLQAQLCLQLGPKPYIELKKVGVRTIFQLEQMVATGPADLVQMIGSAMYANAEPARLTIIAEPTATPRLNPETVQYAVRVMCNDPYIVGLRRLWRYVNGLPPDRAPS